ncbi:unnamed protein product [Leptidea sinapis]|uniref:Uncharacterized protein n=1 Tax=Leptidea sinapis TaxID=189913 RepID=A0A5E4QYF9_9NEOP|nr:unnamed protein product [Leptidea sinapis]
MIIDQKYGRFTMVDLLEILDVLQQRRPSTNPVPGSDSISAIQLSMTTLKEQRVRKNNDAEEYFRTRGLRRFIVRRSFTLL